MADDLAWIGEHWYSGAPTKDGMLANICLTAVRGMDPVDLVVRLGADRRMAERPVPFKDFDRLGRDMVVGRGGELLCLTRFLDERPWLSYADAVGELRSAEPGDSLPQSPVPREDRLGRPGPNLFVAVALDLLRAD